MRVLFRLSVLIGLCIAAYLTVEYGLGLYPLPYGTPPHMAWVIWGLGMFAGVLVVVVVFNLIFNRPYQGDD